MRVNISSQTQNMMRLLSQVILADGHILDSELTAFTKGAQVLGLSDISGGSLTSEDISVWFTSYLDELNANPSDVPRDIALTTLILSLAEWPDKSAVVETLEAISKADAEFHKEEKSLISIVKAYWQYEGLDTPGATIEV